MRTGQLQHGASAHQQRHNAGRRAPTAFCTRVPRVSRAATAAAQTAGSGAQHRQLQQQQQQHLQQADKQPQQELGRRAALLGSFGLCCAGASLLSAGRPAAAAAGQPRQLEGEAKAALDRVLDQYVTKAKSPVLLRLAYHDAAPHRVVDGFGGANASIQYELDRPENFGLKRGWNVIQQIASALDRTPAAGRVSKADLIALSGARAVAVCGGPVIELPVGRPDATAADPPGRMASEKAGAEALKANFADKGLGVQQLVALSGAHTLGGKGFGDPVTFDNAYYTALLAKPWLNPNDDMASMIGLPSDHVLPDDPECLKFIEAYAADQALFFRDFAAAYAQLASLGVTAWA